MVKVAQSNNDEKYMYLQQGANFLGQLGQKTGLIGGGAVGFMNSIMDVAWGDHGQKVAGIEQLASIFVSLVDGGIFDKAKSDVKDCEKDIQEGERKVIDAKIETNKTINKIIKEIEADSKKIKKITEKLGKEYKKEEEKFNKQLEKEKKEVKENIEVLNDPSANKEDKEEALAAIKDCSAAIKEILGQADEFSKSIEEKTSKVDELQANIVTKSNDANEEIATQLNKMKALENETASKAIKKCNNFTTQGGEEVVVGEELQTKAAAIVAGTAGTGTVAAEELEKAALNNIKAGKTHISGSAKNLTTLGRSLGEMGGNYASVSSYATTVGSALTEAEKIIGAYHTKCTEIIKSIGSLETPTDEYQKGLETAIDQYESAPDENKQFNFEYSEANPVDLIDTAIDENPEYDPSDIINKVFGMV
ncbi:MAG: hypothetical protein MJ230_02450 [bacterium]|nr:hypothetical protein [bacterium]